MSQLERSWISVILRVLLQDSRVGEYFIPLQAGKDRSHVYDLSVRCCCGQGAT